MRNSGYYWVRINIGDAFCIGRYDSYLAEWSFCGTEAILEDIDIYDVSPTEIQFKL